MSDALKIQLIIAATTIVAGLITAFSLRKGARSDEKRTREANAFSEILSVNEVLRLENSRLISDNKVLRDDLNRMGNRASDHPREEITILMVEDRDEDAELTRTILLQHNSIKEVRWAQTLKEARDVLLHDNDEIDVIILDLNLVEVQGIETLERMRRLEPIIPIIVLTDFVDYGVQARLKGAVAFIPKPSTLSDDTLARAAISANEAKLRR